MYIKYVIALFAVVLISGCATAYKPIGIGGGYRDMSMDVDKHYVMVSGNGYTSKTRVFDIAIRRGAELCKENTHHKYTKLQLLDNKESTDSSIISMPVMGSTYQSGNYYSNTGSGTYSGYSYGTRYVPVNVNMHSGNYYFQCHEDDGIGFDIEKVLKDTKYLI